MNPNNQVYPNQPPPQAPQPGQATYSPYSASGQPPVTQPGQPPMQPSGQGNIPDAPVKTNPNSTQNTLLISEIRDGIVIMNDGSFRGVIMLKSINFDLMSPQERDGVEYGYQGFLNSLYFPVQIFVSSIKVDLGLYLQKLDKIRSEHDNMLLSLLMEDYISYMAGLAEQTNIMDKKFYLVIPFFPTADAQKVVQASKGFLEAIIGKKEQKVVINEADLEAAKTELRDRSQAVLSGLMQCGIQGLPLDTNELIELYYDAYNPDTATRQQLKNFDDLTAPIVTKGQGNAYQPNLERELQ
jgi:hypothetical protein